MFGWFALSLITDGKLPGLAPAAEPAAQPTADGEDAPSDGRASNGETAAGTTKAGDADEPPAGEDGPGFIEVDLPTRTYFVLQHGIFSTPEAARSAQAALEDLGFAGVGEQRERIHVYAGLAVNRSDADALKRKLEQAEAEVYVKEYAVPAVRRIRWTGGKASGVAGGTAADYFHAADELVGLIARLTAVRINAGEPMPFDAQSIETIGERHRAWSAHAVAAAAGLQEEDRETLERMDNAVNTAVMLLAAYNRNPASSYLWQAQAAALQYVLLENGLLAKIAAD
jgi:stage II sporulation protein B